MTSAALFGTYQRAVEAVQVVARHRLQIARPPDRRVVIAVRLEGRRGDLGVEHLLRIVVAAIELREDDRALGLAVVGMIEAARHPLRFDEEHAVERVARGSLEVRGLIDPGVAVPAAAELLYDALHFVAGNVGSPLEVHVLDPVSDAGQARAFVLRSDLVPAPYRGQRGGAHLLDEHREPVVEHHAPQRRRRRQGLDFRGHSRIISRHSVLLVSPGRGGRALLTALMSVSSEDANAGR